MKSNRRLDKLINKLNNLSLFWHVVLFIIIGVIAWIIIFIFFINRFARDSTSLYQIAQTTAITLGALTVGSAAVIQYRKQKILENQSYSERFSGALGHLESSEDAVKKGALYEFKRLAMDSTYDIPDIYAVISSFLRQRIEQGPGQTFTYDSTVFVAGDVLSSIFEKHPTSGRYSLRHLEATGVILMGIHLRGADLASAHFGGAHLEGADLECTNLWRADFTGTFLKNASFYGSDRTEAVFENAHDADFTQKHPQIIDRYK